MRFTYDPADVPDELDDLMRLLGAKRSVFTLATTLGQVGIFCLVTESGSAAVEATS